MIKGLNDHNVSKIKIYSIAIFCFFAFASSASALVISPIEYAPDDWRSGDDRITDYFYGGTIFTSDNNFTFFSINFNVCASATTTPIDAHVKFYHLLNGVNTDISSSANYDDLGFFYLTVPPCPNDGSATSTFPASVSTGSFSNGQPPPIIDGESYAMVFQGVSLDHFDKVATVPWIVGVTTGTNLNGVELCSTFITCGYGIFNASGRTAVPSFSFTDVNIETLTCGFTTLADCFQIALQWAFVPSDTTLNSFSDLKDTLKDRAPFGYFTSAYTTIESFNASSTSQFALATSSPIMQYIFTPLRTGLTWLFLFAGLYWLYKRLTNIHI